MKKIVLILILLTKLISGVSYSQTTFIPTSGTTIYDLQSTGPAKHIVQDKNNPDNIHAVYIVSPYSDTSTYSQRTVNYYFSSDRGDTWSFKTSFPEVNKAGFPSLSVLSNGSAIISLHGGAPKKTYTFVDAFPGLGSFTNLGTSLCFDMLPQIVVSNNISEFRKFHIINQVGFTSGLSLTTNSYTPCIEMQGISSDAYSIAISQNGRIGIVYVVDVAQLTGNSGDVFFIESFDNGETFTAPLKIYDATIKADNTFLGAFRGISLVYNNNTPNIVFEVVHQHLSGNYFPNKPGGIMYWSSRLSGADPNRSTYIARNDVVNSYSSYIPFYKSYGNYEITSICRPSIGTFSDSNYMAVVFMAATQNIKVTGFDTASYNSVYLTYTYNKGLSWTKPKKITPDERMDWTFPSISPFNVSNSIPYKANISATKDTIPGSYVLNNLFVKSLAQQYYIKSNVGLNVEPIAVTTTTGSVKYNDSFELVTGGIVKALRFDESTGQEIITATSPIDINGNYSFTFEAPNHLQYIVAYPNSEPVSDFVPTYYPQTIDWKNALTINSANNNLNINIGVYRKIILDGPYSISGVVNKTQNNIYTIFPRVNIYIKSGDFYLGFVESLSSGRYNFMNMPSGNFEIIVNKLGFSTAARNIPLNSIRDSVNFTLNQVLTVGNTIPEKYSLHQNYPNPFNPVTNIKFDIPKASYVKINVYNVLGKEVSLLMSENKPAGRYSIDFDASSLTSGVYFYKIDTGDFAETKRMVILK
jgi:hypothetical protein